MARSLRKVLAATVVATYMAGPPYSAQTAEAPFGLVWFQKQETLPHPSSMENDGNIVVLTYEGSSLPSFMKDAASVIMKVCQRQGLQQVRWFSRTFSLSGGAEKFFDIYEEGVKLYGQADEGDVDQGKVAWSRERIGMRLYKDGQEGFRIVMITDGPQFEQCVAEHNQITGRE
jgi:hypothetical protein